MFTAYLDCDEYERQLARIRICCCIDEGRYSEAKEQIAAYRKTTKNNIHMQYLCLAECELMQKTGSSVSACKDKLIEGIREKKFFGVGLDVYEEEGSNVFENREDEVLQHSTTARLLSFPNVIVTSDRKSVV